MRFDHTVHVKIKKKKLEKYNANAKALDCYGFSELVRLLLDIPVEKIKKLIKDRG
ncbi:hypothetical protein KAR91_77175 [Candidatus Pacearchaeota archaeon]|nr:hypothetical protein [Candidatus Pacearchaeota archaeon]